jgi:hypothetical protein
VKVSDKTAAAFLTAARRSVEAAEYFEIWNGSESIVRFQASNTLPDFTDQHVSIRFAPRD